MPKAPAKAEPADEAPTEVEAPADTATRREPRAEAPADRPASEAPTRVDEPTQTEARAGDATPNSSPGHNPFTRRDNGRAQDARAPDRDALARESRS